MQVKGGLNNFDFFNWLLNVKNLVLSNGSDNTCKMRSNGIEIAFFSKNYKNRGASPPDPQIPPAAGGPTPNPPSAIYLSYTSFLNTLPKLDICIFQLLVQALFLCKIRVTCKQATTISDLLSYDIFVPQKLPLWKNFDDVISCDLWFKLPQSKILGTPMNWRSPEKKFLKTFFFLESTCACVLGPWPRAFLSLASRGSVLGNAVLGLGLGFFLCPWPRALFPQLHLWLLPC